jgi:hypothetical protein
MRQDFVIVRSATADQDERVAELPELARRIHAWRDGGAIELYHAVVARPDCVGVRRVPDQGYDLFGYVFFPERRAWIWPQNRAALSRALHAQCADLVSEIAPEGSVNILQDAP